MSFLFAAALSITLLIAVPLLAHLLRRGRARPTPFAATALVPALEHVAKQRSRFQDRALLAVRVAMLLGLALLGAVPLVRCDRVSFARHQGASVAAMLVLDDSASMRSRLPSGTSRFAKAKGAALELLDQMQQGDTVGVVLAGKPARMLLLPGENADLLRAQLEQITESDRPTDLQTAIALAESTLDRAVQRDKQVLVLSDLAGDIPTSLSSRVSALVPELAQPINDCAIVSALQNGSQIAVELACSVGYPATERQLQLSRESNPKQRLTERTVSLHEGRELVVLDSRVDLSGAVVRLGGKDDNPHDDSCPVVTGGSGMSVATYSDPVEGRGTTGGAPVLEQALRALDTTLAIKPLPAVPEDARDLAGLDLLLLDNPPLLSAEARAAITDFVQRGGIAVAFLGAAADDAQLGSLMLPFVEKRAVWEHPTPSGLEPKSLIELGASAASLANLAAKGRLLFDESHDAKVVVKGRWTDERPFWIERPLGRGFVVTFGLPTSVEQSDFALRTGFVAILDRMLREGRRQGRARVTTAGHAWRWPSDGSLRVEGPSGELAVEASGHPDRTERVIVPASVGRYRVEYDGQREERVALFPAEEVLEPARAWPKDRITKPDEAAGRIELSRPIVLALLALAWLELALGSTTLRGALEPAWAWTKRRLLPDKPSRAP